MQLSQVKGGKDTARKSKEKVARIRLSREQEAWLKDLLSIENRVAVVRLYINRWLDFFKFFADDITEREITPEEEKRFFEICTELARRHFLATELMADTFSRGADVIEVLTKAVSLNHIQQMQENTRAKLELDWHGIYLDMNKALGRLVRQWAGDMPLSQALQALKETDPIDASDLKRYEELLQQKK